MKAEKDYITEIALQDRSGSGISCLFQFNGDPRTCVMGILHPNTRLPEAGDMLYFNRLNDRRPGVGVGEFNPNIARIIYFRPRRLRKRASDCLI